MPRARRIVAATTVRCPLVRFPTRPGGRAGRPTYGLYVDLVESSATLAERLLSGFPDRWRHVQGVAALARELGRAFQPSDRDALVAAAFLHDIGYASSLHDTGLHALDGARYLRREGVDDRVACLVAHHSYAVAEAELRGLRDVLQGEFAPERSAVADALWYCDMTVGPDGQPAEASHRLTEIRHRYGSDHIVSQAIDRAEAELLAAVGRTERRLGLASVAG